MAKLHSRACTSLCTARVLTHTHMAPTTPEADSIPKSELGAAAANGDSTTVPDGSDGSLGAGLSPFREDPRFRRRSGCHCRATKERTGWQQLRSSDRAVRLVGFFERRRRQSIRCFYMIMC